MARFWKHNERLSPYDDNAFTDEELESLTQTVRESSFIDDESGRTIDERMTEFFGGFEPGWIGFQAPDEVCYVNCYGVLRRGRQAIKVELQFELSDDLESFALTGLSINNRPQPESAVADFEASFAAPDPDSPSTGSLPDEPEDDGWYDDEDEDGELHEHGASCGCAHHHDRPRRELYDFDADYVEPPEEEKPARTVSYFGNYGAFPAIGADGETDDTDDYDERSLDCCEDDDDDCENGN